MPRDYTKYSVEGLGENLNKRELVFTVVKDYVEKNNPSFEDLQKAFPDEVQGSKGFIRKETEVKDPKRFNMREPLKIMNGAHVVVSNQWGRNINDFIEAASKLGYTIFDNNDKISSGNDSSGVKRYIFIQVEDNNKGNDLALLEAEIVQSNGKYTLSVGLSHDGEGVVISYSFYDIKTKVFGSDSAPWGFDDGFVDEDDEFTGYNSLENLGYDSNKIGDELFNLKEDFVKRFLNEASQEPPHDEAAMPSDKRDMLREDVHGHLVFEEGEESIVP